LVKKLNMEDKIKLSACCKGLFYFHRLKEGDFSKASRRVCLICGKFCKEICVNKKDRTPEEKKKSFNGFIKVLRNTK